MSLPKISQLDFATDVVESVTETTSVHRTFAWDFERGDFKLDGGRLIELEGVEYLRVWIEKAIRTVKNTFIYKGTGYGSDHHSLIGRTFKRSFTESEFERMLRECLTQNDAITGVTNFVFTPSGSWLTIEFSVMSIYGVTREVVTV